MNTTKKVILSFDGGGTRGVMESIMLVAIENKLRKKYGDHVRIIDFVDVLTGASTGGIIAALLAHPKRYTAEQVVDFYNDHCYDIFNNSKKKFHTGLIDSNKYKVDTLESLLKKYFGDLKMQDLKGHVIISAIDLISKEAAFFSNKKSKNKILETYHVWKALRSTSAAPTYFKPMKLNTDNRLHELICIDGGMVANDMSVCAAAKLQKPEYGETPIHNIAVINIGSGANPPKIDKPDKKKGILEIAQTLPMLMLYSNVNVVKYQCTQFRFGHYFALDIPKKYRNYNEDMADASNKNMQKMRLSAIKTLECKKDEVKEIVDFLGSCKDFHNLQKN